MKRTALKAGLLVLVAMGPIGCKSASSLAWWKNNRAGESTAVAHSAPQLPSDAAKQAEARQLNAAQLAGGDAAPYKAPTTSTVAATPGATAAPADYPTTSAPPFTPSASTQAATTASTAQQPSAASLGSIALPYDPSKAPQAKSTASAAPTVAATADRYGSALANMGAQPTTTDLASAPAYGQPPAGGSASATAPPAINPGVQVNQAIAAASGAADRYAASTIDAAQYAGASAANSVGNAVNGALETAASSYGGGRYQLAPTTTGTQAVSPATTNVAASTPYRPGGTSSYPGSGADSTLLNGVQVASRPSTATSATVPHVAVPSTTTTQPAAPSRY